MGGPWNGSGMTPRRRTARVTLAPRALPWDQPRMSATHIPNRDARRLWLGACGLLAPPVGADGVAGTVGRLGLVQLDSIRVVERAHDHILWSRDRTHRVGGLDRSLRRREVFEHFTHDASVLPMDLWPHWRRAMARRAAYMRAHPWYDGLPDEAGLARVRDWVAEAGPVAARDWPGDRTRPAGTWKKAPHKLALDYLWSAGALATCHRRGFEKAYDLAERIVPDALRGAEVPEAAQIDRLARMALDRLVLATPGALKRFWEAMDAGEVAAWLDANGDAVEPVAVEAADGSVLPMLAVADWRERLAALPEPSSGLRVLSPFDPLVRDRPRALALFGFDYRIEIFVPAAKRRFGYYVFPLLRSDRFVGRAEIVRGQAGLEVANLWPEPGVRWGKGLDGALAAEVGRMGRLAGV